MRWPLCFLFQDSSMTRGTFFLEFFGSEPVKTAWRSCFTRLLELNSSSEHLKVVQQWSSHYELCFGIQFYSCLSISISLWLNYNIFSHPKSWQMLDCENHVWDSDHLFELLKLLKVTITCVLIVALCFDPFTMFCRHFDLNLQRIALSVKMQVWRRKWIDRFRASILQLPRLYDSNSLRTPMSCFFTQ